MHKIDDQALVDALVDVIKSTIEDKLQWQNVQNSLQDEKVIAILSAHEWSVLEIMPPRRGLQSSYHRSDFTLLESIILNTTQNYFQVKRAENVALEITEEDRICLRKKVAGLLPEAFSSDEFKQVWQETREAIREAQLSAELRCILRFTKEKADALLMRTASISVEAIRKEFELKILHSKKEIEKVGRGATVENRKRSIHQIEKIRTEFQTIDLNLPATKDLFSDEIQTALRFLTRLKNEVTSQLNAINAFLAENELSFVNDHKLPATYSGLVHDLNDIEKNFPDVLCEIPLQGLRSGYDALLLLISATANLQKRTDLLFHDARAAKAVGATKAPPVVHQGIYRRRVVSSAVAHKSKEERPKI